MKTSIKKSNVQAFVINNTDLINAKVRNLRKERPWIEEELREFREMGSVES